MWTEPKVLGLWVLLLCVTLFLSVTQARVPYGPPKEVFRRGLQYYCDEKYNSTWCETKGNTCQICTSFFNSMLESTQEASHEFGDMIYREGVEQLPLGDGTICVIPRYKGPIPDFGGDDEKTFDFWYRKSSKVYLCDGKRSVRIYNWRTDRDGSPDVQIYCEDLRSLLGEWTDVLNYMAWTDKGIYPNDFYKRRSNVNRTYSEFDWKTRSGENYLSEEAKKNDGFSGTPDYLLIMVSSWGGDDSWGVQLGYEKDEYECDKLPAEDWVTRVNHVGSL